MQVQIRHSKKILHSVSQLDKTPFPTLKPLPTKDLSVGRHEDKNLHTPTHAGKFIDIKGLKSSKNKYFKLHKNAESHFLQTIPLLFELLENLNVVFHNNDYVNEIFANYYPIHAHLFLEWVKTFAIIRNSCRTQLSENVIQTNEEDFLTALRLFKLQIIKPKFQPKKHNEKIWEAITEHFADKPFGSRDIENKTCIHYCSVGTILLQLKEQGKLKRIKKAGAKIQYQLIKK